MKKVLLTCAATGAFLVASSASMAAAMTAAPAFNPWYVGIGVGATSGIVEKVETNDKLETNRLGVDVFAGYNLTKHFGTELGYNYIGRRSYEVNTDNTSHDINGWDVYYDALAYMPLGQYFKVFAKGGVDYLAISDAATNYAAMRGSESKLKTFGMNFGAGLQFNYQQFGARLVYTDLQTLTFRQKNDANFNVPNLLGLDIMYFFG